MNKIPFYYCIGFTLCLLLASSCIPHYTVKTESRFLPDIYDTTIQDTVSIAKLNWRAYYADDSLAALIDTALKNNQELNVFIQELEVAKNEVHARRGEYLPFVRLKAGVDYTKESAYTATEAIKESVPAANKQNVLESNTNVMAGIVMSWEVDIWQKLSNASKAAMMRYLANVEGKNFMQTKLIAEIASSYYELMALDNLLDIVDTNTKIQSNALKSVKLQKESAKVSQLAVNRFEAQLLNTQNLQFTIKQKIVETENRIHFLTGIFPRTIRRNSRKFMIAHNDTLQRGIPAQLLQNRPDIRKAEFELAAAKLDVDVARASFFPSLGIKAGIGFQAFNPAHLVNPESLIFNVVGDLIAPLINRNAIEAAYSSASAKQIQAVYLYEQSILNAYTDVVNQLAKNENYTKSYETKSKEVDILLHSVTIANNLFNSARADYVEVLLTQEEALKSKMELIEIKLQQMNAKINLYRALGGGWH